MASGQPEINHVPQYLAVDYRKVGELNRVVLPELVRKAAGIKSGDDIMIATDGNAIYIVPNKVRCNICGSTRGVRSFKNFAYVCDACTFKIIEMHCESEEIGDE